MIRNGLKIRWKKFRAGSSPAARTSPLPSNSATDVLQRMRRFRFPGASEVPVVRSDLAPEADMQCLCYFRHDRARGIRGRNGGDEPLAVAGIA